MINLTISYQNLDDNKLVNLAQKNDAYAFEHLLDNYCGMISYISKAYYIKGTEKEDVYQEALIGFYKAIRDYKFELNTKFSSFANICIRRQIITALKTATRNKHLSHLTSVSIDKPINSQNMQQTNFFLYDIIPNDKVVSPEFELLYGEEKLEFKETVRVILSELELKVLELYSEGLTYVEIAKKVGRNTKSVDASLNRAKRKLRDYYHYQNKTLDMLII
ncbi:sigma-70 family RNA polymerase sigma factor [Niallia sp. Man26]|uniref:sigma-70 family RNA polymerase sigma factor n=1 Tax=Niallia sp. Man26 TaxID=2912824 RepID=UPI001EDBBD01|nr:sigma-70 family RNA polymerase sigma factor [Niallia sp. Man26]UPO91083.1 sigma-70 family RNA polymerase sigma factor [Niallia sp. Man26]